MIIGIIAGVMIGLLIIHYMYTNWRKFRELRQSWDTRVAPLQTVTAVEVRAVPVNTQVIMVTEEIIS